MKSSRIGSRGGEKLVFGGGWGIMCKGIEILVWDFSLYVYFYCLDSEGE